MRICRYLISKLTWFEEVAIAPLCQAKNTMQIRLREQEVGEMHLGFLEIFVDSEVNSSQPAQPSMFFWDRFILSHTFRIMDHLESMLDSFGHFFNIKNRTAIGSVSR